MGVPDHVMESITGHLSRRMLEHYSHVLLDAKRKVLEELDAWRQRAAQAYITDLGELREGPRQ